MYRRTFPEAAQWYERAAKSGDDDAKSNLGLLYAEGGPGMQRDPVRAAQLYREAAEAGNGLAQNNLGAAYMKGEGVERNDAEAIQWLTRSAEQDVAAAQSTLAAVYCGGDKRPNPIKRDSDLCDKWLKRAVALGNEDAKKAMFYLTSKMAEKGQTQAMHNLGGFYLMGMGTTVDVEKGLEWMTKAAEAGVKQSQYQPVPALRERRIRSAGRQREGRLLESEILGVKDGPRPSILGDPHAFNDKCPSGFVAGVPGSGCFPERRGAAGELCDSRASAVRFLGRRLAGSQAGRHVRRHPTASRWSTAAA